MEMDKFKKFVSALSDPSVLAVFSRFDQKTENSYGD